MQKVCEGLGNKVLEDITPMILTLNEIANIKRTLAKLFWAKRIVVVDSGSTDGTLDVLENVTQACIFRRQFDSFAEQCNFALKQIRTKWVLSLDADYELSDELIQEMRLIEKNDIAGYRVPFVYCVYGRPLSRSLYPPRTVLYRVQGAEYVNEGHGHRVCVAGQIGQLKGAVRHDDRKPLTRWLATQRSYAILEVDYLLRIGRKNYSRSDRIRQLGWAAPILVFVYVLFVKGCVLSGWIGWFYALQRLVAETMIALELVDRRLRAGSNDYGV